MKRKNPTKILHLLHLLLMSTLLIILILPTALMANSNAFEREKTQNVIETLPQSSSSDDNNQAFKPFMWKPYWADTNNNSIADSLDEEITNRSLNYTDGNYVNVITALRNPPTANDANAFTTYGGYLTTSPWTYAIYGFGGQIPYNQITNFVQSDPNVLLIDKEHISYAQIAYAARQVGARTYVWNTVGIKGDPNASIAIVDTGLDDSHPDFSPGYGDQNFTKKIVGWEDLINSSTTTPYDDHGHGSHVAGLATGNGFYSTNASTGNPIATWGMNFGVADSGRWFTGAMMVNKTGTIIVRMKWKSAGTTKVTAVRLFYGDKNLDYYSWIPKKSMFPTNPDTWYTMTYDVTSTPSGGYDMYHIFIDTQTGNGDLYAMFTTSWPYTPLPNDGYPVWTGIAPDTKLVGVKVMAQNGTGTDTGLLNAIEWIIANKQAYHIVITSMSLGFGEEVTTVDAALVNLVNSGVTTVVSAGNRGTGSNLIYTPASVDEVITVAALNQFDNIASYSSQGGTSRYTGKTVKPDVTAPGGSFYAVPLLSADTNDNEAEGGWSEVNLNDSTFMQGTSMSAPVVSGAASIIVKALGGFANWQYTRSQALKPKMFLLMTATETYPNIREPAATGSPTLERGGKDAHEGYGRLNLDAAVDAILKTHQIGTTVTGTLGKPPALTDISVLGQKLAWARKVQLNTEGKYNFTLTVPAGADFDLYLYNSTGTWYGEPAIVAKSINATTGGLEQIILTAPYNGTYYLVVKRATATTGAGTFTLKSAFTPKHDVAVLGAEPSATKVYEGNKLNITVTVKNKGLNTESFNVTAFYNNTSIDKQTVSNLPASDTTTLNFTWNTLGRTFGNYTIKAQADPVPNEYNTTDNTLTYNGFVYVKIPGDVNSDGTVDILDLADLSKAYGSTPTSTNWNLQCDFNRDNLINVLDLRTLGKNYGKHI